MLNIEAIESQTDAALAAGVRQFQAFLAGVDDAEHASRLLALMAPPDGAVVVDAGCGIGETARLMVAERPDLRFILINLSRHQLDLCPDGMERHCADFRSMPVPTAGADVVMYAYSATQCEDLGAVFAEASRVLKPGGQVFMVEMADVGGCDRSLWRGLGACVRSPDELAGDAGRAGFHVEDALILEPKVDQLKLLVDADAHARLTHGIASAVFVLRKPVIDLSRFSNPALQFSGGKDSLACLYLLRDQLDKLTVYWVNTGDGLPETRAVIDEVRQWIPRFVEINTDVKAWREQHGMPSDLVPASATPIGNAYGMSKIRLSGRFDCCSANLMQPMHQRMLADGVDAVIRGTKVTDTGRVPAEGPTEFYEIVLPIRNWSHQDVFDYLRSVGAPQNPVYEHFGAISAPECMGCTAWWDDRKSEYLRARHPELLPAHRDNLLSIRAAVQKHLRELESEIEGVST